MLYFFKKIKKNTWGYYYFTVVYQTSWWYSLILKKNQNIEKMKYPKPQPYQVRFLRYGVRQTKLFLILHHSLPFYPPSPPNSPENQNFEKKKKAFSDVIILHLCTKNQDHMFLEIWSAAADNFLLFLTISCCFTKYGNYWP